MAIDYGKTAFEQLEERVRKLEEKAGIKKAIGLPTDCDGKRLIPWQSVLQISAHPQLCFLFTDSDEYGLSGYWLDWGTRADRQAVSECKLLFTVRSDMSAKYKQLFDC